MGWESRSQGCLWSFGLEHLLFTEMAKWQEEQVGERRWRT
jgi:hypothetical protein